MSQLEREFKLDMEGDEELEAIGSGEDEFEDLPLEGEGPDGDHELDDTGQESSDYADRLHELSLREYESESEIDSALNEVLNDMEQEFFFGKLRRGWNRFKKKGLGKLLNKAVSMAAGRQVPGH